MALPVLAIEHLLMPRLQANSSRADGTDSIIITELVKGLFKIHTAV